MKFGQVIVQAVKVNGILSSFTKVTSGVPQGSVLGPLLFIIMMFDVNASLCYTFIGSFADDTRLWKAITDISSCNELQDDLNATIEWADLNNMQFNNKKFELIRYGIQLLEALRQYVTSDSEVIKCKDHVRDLGVAMSNDLTFSHHIKNIVAKARKLSGWILRTFKSRNKDVLITLFKSLVIPVLEYCSPLWSPFDSFHVKLLERVQREYTKRISDFSTYQEDLGYDVCYIPYQERLQKLNIFSLQRRRDRYMLIYVFKIIHGYQPNAGFQWTFNARTGFHLSPFGHSDTCPHWVRKIRSNTIFDRGCRTFNLLPVNLRQGNVKNLPERKHLSSFKSALSTFLKTVPDLPDINDNSLLFHLQMKTH